MVMVALQWLVCTSCFAKVAFQTPEQIVCTEFQRRLADFVRKDTSLANKSQQDRDQRSRFHLQAKELPACDRLKDDEQ